MKQIGTDFQGWPIGAMTLEEILEQLGFKKGMRRFYIDKNNHILKAYPRIIDDDGMAYGVNPRYITEADNSTYMNGIKTIDYKEDPTSELGYRQEVADEQIEVFNLFTDVPENKTEEEDDN